MNNGHNEIIVHDNHFKFLRLQKGKLEPLANNRDKWLKAYREAIAQDFNLMKPHLPKVADGSLNYLLDVGSGLGGVDILIHRYYADMGSMMIPCLLDGRADKPVMTLHRLTYNDMEVAADFHKVNGVPPIQCVDAAEPMPLPDKAILVISLGSWCFHYAPEVYLNYVKANIAPGGRVIVDVRKDKPDWAGMIHSAFRWRGTIHTSKKFDRIILDA